MLEDRIEREIEVAAPAARVWAALTEREHLAAWFGDAGAEVDLRPGGAITFSWQKHGKARAVIERVEPPTYFSYRWALQPDTEPRPGNSTLVEFTLEEHAASTRLRLVESGFRSLEWSGEEKARHVRDNVAGWATELQELADYLEGQAV
jgi:uncharacterized protein YndB with AHSA1/START domain